MKQFKFQLKNKMNVLLIQSQKSPVVSVQMWVKTGSADEKKGEEGISHFIEHLVFKGTDKYKVGEIAQTVEAAGGELNAYTSFDQTVFYVTISKSFSHVALDVISQMMGYPTFEAAEVDSEREVVCEEIKMGQDSPGRRSSKLVFSSSYKKHPYGLPVIGYDKNVRGWSNKKLIQYYRSRYVPSNMFLVVSGDFEIKDMKNNVEQFFGGFKPYKLKKVKRSAEPKQKKFRCLSEKFEAQDRHLHLAFRGPNVKHKDVAALDVLAMVLGQGDSSLLVRKMRLEKNVASSISAFSYTPQDAGIFALSAQFQDEGLPTAEKTKAVVSEILSCVGEIQAEEVPWSEIKRARVAISSEQFYSLETVDGLANKAGSNEFYLNDANAHKKYLAEINKVTPADVKKVAKKYLKLDHLSASFLGSVNEGESKKWLAEIPTLWKTHVDGRKDVKSKQKKMTIPRLTSKDTAKSEKVQVEEMTLKSGLKVIFCPSKEIPTVSAKLIFKGGARFETADKMGLSEIMSRAWLSGTSTKPENVVLRSIEELAMGFSPFSGKNTFGFSIEYLSAFEKQALALSFELIEDPIFSDEVVSRELSIMAQQIKSKDDHPSTLCGRQFVKALFRNHPISFDQIGTTETLKKLNRNEILNLKKNVLHADGLVVTVVGDYDKKLWISYLQNLENHFARQPRVEQKFPLQPIGKTETIYLEKDKEQSHVIVGWRGLSLSDTERFTLQAIQAILAGQGGRLFTELRDKNSLAYSVAPIKMESVETGYFGGYIACSPEKVDKAVQMMLTEFNKLTTETVPQVEIERAQRYLIGQHDIGLQRKSALCNLLAFDSFYGNDFYQSLHVAAEYEKVTAIRIKALAQKLFSQPYVVSVVGKQSLSAKAG